MKKVSVFSTIFMMCLIINSTPLHCSEEAPKSKCSPTRLGLVGVLATAAIVCISPWSLARGALPNNPAQNSNIVSTPSTECWGYTHRVRGGMLVSNVFSPTNSATFDSVMAELTMEASEKVIPCYYDCRYYNHQPYPGN